MRTVRLLAVTTLIASGLVVLVPSARASAATTPKVCETFTRLNKELDSLDPTDKNGNFNREALQNAAATFRSAAKDAPKKVKSAMRTIANIYDDIGNENNVTGAVSAFAKNAKKYSKAIATWSSYIVKNCGGS